MKNSIILTVTVAIILLAACNKETSVNNFEMTPTPIPIEESKIPDNDESVAVPEESTEKPLVTATESALTTFPPSQYEGERDYVKAYIDKINECEKEYMDLEYDLIYLDEDDIPELVVGKTGYYVSVYTYYSEKLHIIMDDWAYGAMGNAGYEYIPKVNVVRNYNADLAGAILYTSYCRVNENYEMHPFYDGELSIWMFKDINDNYMMDEGEYNDTDLYYYIGDQEITSEEYDAYLKQGDYEFICGCKSASELIGQLKSNEKQE